MIMHYKDNCQREEKKNPKVQTLNSHLQDPFSK